MMFYGNSEEEKYENGEEENKQESKNLDVDERNVDPGTARNTEEPQAIPLMQSYIRIGVVGGFSHESPSDKCLASRVDNSSLPAGK